MSILLFTSGKYLGGAFSAQECGWIACGAAVRGWKRAELGGADTQYQPQTATHSQPLKLSPKERGTYIYLKLYYKVFNEIL